ncbi:unnamed protein product [Angiostrongylus costaricensis]|uniref:Uncharacterized protein n=1 Tax=Angiostrongylus costaricensis TaxID=334426 RepID=A0A0R3Q1J6_ANGCS|nr:unnamed protein product [Angiostrongylus costaricensis]
MECIEDFMKDMRKAAESSSKVVEELIEQAKSSLKVLKERKAKCQLELEELRLKDSKFPRKVSKGGGAKNYVDSKTTEEELVMNGSEKSVDEESNMCNDDVVKK